MTSCMMAHLTSVVWTFFKAAEMISQVKAGESNNIYQGSVVFSVVKPFPESQHVKD